MQLNKRNRLSIYAGIITAFLVCSSLILLTHRLGKLPDEPFWTSPVTMYDNYAFAIMLGLSLPYPYWTGALLLLLVGWASYRVGKKLFCLIFKV